MIPKTVAIIQARTGATRLPGKVLLPIEGKELLARVVSRVQKATTLDEVIVATTTNKSDDAIVNLCRKQGWLCYQGSELDVLDRYYQIAQKIRARVIVRITADCPLIDPKLIDVVVKKFCSLLPHSIDYVSNILPRTYPRGLDTEVMSRAVLEREWNTCQQLREHVTMNIRNHPEQYRIDSVSGEKDYSYMRWTVDTAEDLEFARKVYHHFGENKFGWEDVVRLLSKYPDWVIRDTQTDPI